MSFNPYYYYLLKFFCIYDRKSDKTAFKAISLRKHLTTGQASLNNPYSFDNTLPQICQEFGMDYSDFSLHIDKLLPTKKTDLYSYCKYQVSEIQQKNIAQNETFFLLKIPEKKIKKTIIQRNYSFQTNVAFMTLPFIDFILKNNLLEHYLKDKKHSHEPEYCLASLLIKDQVKESEYFWKHVNQPLCSEKLAQHLLLMHMNFKADFLSSFQKVKDENYAKFIHSAFHYISLDFITKTHEEKKSSMENLIHKMVSTKAKYNIQKRREELLDISHNITIQLDNFYLKKHIDSNHKVKSVNRL